MANINKNIIMQAGAAVANATNKAAGVSAATPEPGAIISAIQLVNGGRTIGPDALAHFTESVRNKLLSLLVSMEPIQSGSGTPSPDNVRPISGRTGAHVYVSPTSDVADATTYSVDWTSEAGTVYSGTLDVVTGLLTVTWVSVDLGTVDFDVWNRNASRDCYAAIFPIVNRTSSSDNVHALSSIFTPTNYDATWKPWYMSYAVRDGQVIFMTPHDLYADETEFKTAMSGVQFVYELATPLTYQLTPQDVITLVGDNYIWSDSGDVTITE